MRTSAWVLWSLGYYCFTLALLYLDQLTKAYFVDAEPIHALGDWLTLHLHFNTGSAFSLPLPIWLTGGLGLILGTIGLFWPWYLRHTENKISSCRLVSLLAIGGILLAGIWGNTIDRLVYGVVIDFIDLGWWPVFNLADIYLTTMAVGILGYLIFTSFKSIRS